MNLLILGATGPTGHEVLVRAREHRDWTTALVRNPRGLWGYKGAVTVVVGDARNSDLLIYGMRGRDAVISALGRGPRPRNGDGGYGLFADTARALVYAARHTGVRRVVWMSSFGVGDTFRDATWRQKLYYRVMVDDIYADKQEAEEVLRDSDLDWTFVYPTTLTDGPAQGGLRIGESMPMTGKERVSRADVAAFMHDEAHEGRWLRRGVILSS